MLPNFSAKTKVYHCDNSEEYKAKMYQYSTSSHQTSDIKPAAVIYPASVDDIILAVDWARESGVGIAVRTGGHQYSGASSTSGQNIQLDVSETFKTDDDFHYDEVENLIRTGISFSLLEMNNRLREHSVFLPHGQCVHVHLGGHVQTGGYGQLGRAFGLLSDHVQGFEIVIASGELKHIWRPSSDLAKKNEASMDKELNDDLFWAVLGGSPGNYGILTHVYLTPHKDKDHPHSRGMKLFTPYTPERLKKIMQVVAEMNDNQDLAGDFDLCVTMMKNVWNFHLLRKYTPQWLKSYKNIDEEMMYQHPRDYGDGVDSAEDGVMAIPDIPIPLILIYLQWSNIGGADQEFGDKEKFWFEKMREATRPNTIDDTLDVVCHGFPGTLLSIFKDIIGMGQVDNFLQVDYRKHTPLSTLTRFWCFEDIREYVKPYEKRCYMSNKTDLTTNGYVDWVVGRIDKVVQKKGTAIDVVVQIQPFGGNNSRYRLNGRPELHHGCHSWRDDCTLVTVLDCFYQPKSNTDPTDSRLQWALNWQRGNDSGARTYICDEDRRLLWGSYASMEDPDAGANLHSVRHTYFDSEEKYQRLVEIKRRVDPLFIFTSNMFSVGAVYAPQNRQCLIRGVGHDTVLSDKKPKKFKCSVM